MNIQELIEKYEYLNHAYFRRVDTNEVLRDLKQLDEPQKVTIPQFVADWIERLKQVKNFIPSLAYALNSVVWSENNLSDECIDWLYSASNQDIFALAWINGYTVEREKRYIVKVKGMEEGYNILNYRTSADKWFFSGETEPLDYRTKHTRKQLEEAGFGWVFNCQGVEIEEVE